MFKNSIVLRVLNFIHHIKYWCIQFLLTSLCFCEPTFVKDKFVFSFISIKLVFKVLVGLQIQLDLSRFISSFLPSRHFLTENSRLLGYNLSKSANKLRNSLDDFAGLHHNLSCVELEFQGEGSAQACPRKHPS